MARNSTVLKWPCNEMRERPGGTVLAAHLGRPQPVPIGQEHHGRVSMAVAVSPGRLLMAAHRLVEAQVGWQW
jgi:hypothetical protein